jgi:hypothetical protein
VHPLTPFACFALQGIYEINPGQSSPAPKTIPAASLRRVWMQSAVSWTPSSSPQPDAPRRALAFVWKSPEHRRHQVPSHSLTGAAHRNPSQQVSSLSLFF